MTLYDVRVCVCSGPEDPGADAGQEGGADDGEPAEGGRPPQVGVGAGALGLSRGGATQGPAHDRLR